MLNALRSVRGADVIVFDAIDGARELHKTSLDQLKAHARRSMTSGEVGCFLSHAQVLQHAADHLRDRQWALVLEDDTQFTCGNWMDRIRAGVRECPGGILFCGTDTPEVFNAMLGEDCRSEFGRHSWTDQHHSTHCVRAAPRFNTHAYAVSRSGASDILEQLGHIETAIDVQLHFDRIRIPRFALKSGVAVQNKALPSSVQPR